MSYAIVAAVAFVAGVVAAQLAAMLIIKLDEKG